MLRIYLLIIVFFLTGCEYRSNLAPVVELKWHPQNANQLLHRVKKGETLYAVAFRYDQDYFQLAALNHLRSPYILHVGQVLRLKSSAPNSSNYHSIPKPVYSVNRPTPIAKRSSWSFSRPSQTRAGYQKWVWPINGRVTTSFIPQQGKKGIDIAGKKGEKVRAAADGVVAYAGSGLSGYGNLIIIKHNNQILTAYGNNMRNLVKVGHKVKVGQNIAEIGIIDRRYWGVHFEIRKLGQPINPLSYLQ